MLFYVTWETALTSPTYLWLSSTDLKKTIFKESFFLFLLFQRQAQKKIIIIKFYKERNKAKFMDEKKFFSCN